MDQKCKKVDRKFRMTPKRQRMTLKKQRMTPKIKELNLNVLEANFGNDCNGSINDCLRKENKMVYHTYESLTSLFF